MKKALLFALFLTLCTASFGQNTRWDLGSPGGSGVVTTSGSGLPFLVAVPGVQLNWCNYPANASPCTNYASTYPSFTSTSACPTNHPIVLQGTSTCVGTGDNFGNLGVYAVAGNYSYTLTANGVTYGPYAVTLGGSSGGGGGGGGDFTTVLKGHGVASPDGTTIQATNDRLYVSSYCGAITFIPCALYTNASYAMQQMIADAGGTKNNPASLHIVFDICGTNYFTEQPFQGMTGIVEFSANCAPSTALSPNIILVDYPMDTIEIGTNLRIMGQGGNSSGQTPDNTYFAACNPSVDVCPGGGWNDVGNSGPLNSTSVASNIMTINFDGSFNIGTQLNSIQPGRLLHIYGTGTAGGCSDSTNNGAWVVLPSGITITGFTGTSGTLTFTNSGTNGLSAGYKVRLNGFTANANAGLNGQNVSILPSGLSSTQFEVTVSGSGYSGSGASGYANETLPNYIFQVGVPSGVTSQASSCGAYVFLDQSVFALGVGGGTTEYVSSIGNVTIDARDMPASSCLVQADGEEGVGTDGDIQCYNATAFYYRWDQSIGTYGSQNSGDTNSMGSESLQGNNVPLYCTLTTCPCNGGSFGCSSGVAGVAGTVPQGTLMACGAGTTRATISAFTLGNGSQDACQNTNFVGFLDTGGANSQGPGKFKGHMTMSIADKSQGGGVPIAGFAGTIGTGSQASGYGIFGSTGQFDHLHAEYFNIAVAVCGDTATQYTWAKAYGQYLTDTVQLNGGFHAFNTNGIGLDIGTAGNQAYCQDIYAMMNAGLGGGHGYTNNITGSSCTDATFTIWMGHATSPAVPQESSSCSVGNVKTVGGDGSGFKIGVTTNTDMAGAVTFAGGTVSTTYSFLGTYASAPLCVGTPTSDIGSGNRLYISTLTSTSLIFHTTSNFTGTVEYHCWPTK